MVTLNEDAFYALLVMDGDSMGKLVSEVGSSGISKSLNDFADAVDDIVVGHFGQTVYAGGDDVVALLPTTTALKAAEELAKMYSDKFKSHNNPRATLSGALVFAFHKHPLRQVIKMGHHLLDDIAKERSGRNAIAVGIIQGSGLQALWSVPWPVYHGDAGNSKFEDIIKNFGKAKSHEFGGSFLYMMRDRFNKLFEKPLEEPGSFRTVEFGENILVDLAHAEYRRRLKGGTKMKTEDTLKIVKPIFDLTKKWTRIEVDNIFNIKSDDNTFGFDGWRVARFLRKMEEQANKEEK